MPRHQPPPDPALGPVTAFAAALHALRQAAGEPSYRAMAEATHYSHTSLSRAAKGRTLPTWQVTQAFVQFCDPVADLDAWRSQWEAATAARQPTKVPPAAATMPTLKIPMPIPPWPVPQPVLARVSVEPATQRRRVYGMSARPTGAHRAPAGTRSLRAKRRLITMIIVLAILTILNIIWLASFWWSTG